MSAGEVILAAGAIGSPHILQLSGVGDPERLGRASIAAHHELRGVGRDMQDHYLAHVSCTIRGRRVEPTVARTGAHRTGAALSRDRQRDPDLCRVAGRRLGKGAAGIGDARRAGSIRSWQLLTRWRAGGPTRCRA